MNNVFDFEGQRIRHAIIVGEPWFVAADACQVLFERYNPMSGVSPWLQSLDKDEKRTLKRSDIATLGVPLGPKPAGSMVLISRPGLFKLIQRSNQPQAKRFDRVVRHEILPSIMDTGSYTAPDSVDYQRLVRPAPEERPTMTREAMTAPYGSQMYQGDGLDLVALVGRQEARIDALSHPKLLRLVR